MMIIPGATTKRALFNKAREGKNSYIDQRRKSTQKVAHWNDNKSGNDDEYGDVDISNLSVIIEYQ